MKGLLLSKKLFQNSHNMSQEEHGTSISTKCHQAQAYRIQIANSG